MTDKQDLYQEAMKFAKEKASISYVQRKCRCSYNDAERMLEQMVSDGVISTYNGRKGGEAVGAGGVQALSAAPAGWESVIDESRSSLQDSEPSAFDNSGYRAFAETVLDAVEEGLSALAASPTPPAEQQATKETSGGFHVWRDISTAPKDGSRFVATGHNYGLYSEGRHACVAQWFRGSWMEASDWNETSELKYLTHWMPLPSPPDDVAAPAEQQAAPKAAPGVGNSGFDHQTAADFLSGKTVSDEAVRKFVQAARWAHAEKASLSAMLISVRGELASRNAEIALLKRALMEAEAAPQQEAQEPFGYVTTHSKTGQQVFYRYPEPPYLDNASECVTVYTAPQPAPAPLTRDQIREVFMAHGFTIKEGQTDLKQYVYDAAYALLGTKPAPLSDDTKRLAWMADEWTPGHEKLYDKHVLETDGVGGLDDLRTFIDKQIAAQEGKA